MIDATTIRIALGNGWINWEEAKLLAMPPINPTPAQRALLDAIRNRLQSRLLVAELEERKKTARPCATRPVVSADRRDDRNGFAP